MAGREATVPASDADELDASPSNDNSLSKLDCLLNEGTAGCAVVPGEGVGWVPSLESARVKLENQSELVLARRSPVEACLGSGVT